MPFQCSICGEESTRICARCTKDACDNHLCDKCRKCSDCCECEVALSPHAPETVREAIHPETVHTETAVVVDTPEATPAEEAASAPESPAESPTPTEATAEAPAIDAKEAEPEHPADPESEATPTEAAPEVPPTAVAESPLDPAAEAPGSNMLPHGHEPAS